ncbi:MAG: His/Gly/Thr/Pro-type tRNA ligase C-terminal domain-containing protein, partial [Bdellovibrionaceae bacterium]|nr:His/Gly/Thr/Pro-type tRNA ligase C-terminal domain-containing protein [Pseudobdellovibrionaceae bacterium]
MLHRAVLGSLERFIGVYLEHTAGHLPPWLAPTQAVILNVTDRVNSFCEEVLSTLRGRGIRADFDRRNEKLNYKIREAQTAKIPYMLVIGDKEAEMRSVSVRLRDGSQHNSIPLQNLIETMEADIKHRRLKPSLQKEDSH